MAVIIKNLAKGNLVTAGVLTITLQPGTGKSWIVKNVMLTNRNSVANTIDLKAVGMFVAAPSMIIAASSTVVFNDEITLTGASETLSITVAGTTPNLDYVVNGVERDV